MSGKHFVCQRTGRRERVTSRYFETVVTADSSNRGKCSIKTSNRDVSFRKLI